MDVCTQDAKHSQYDRLCIQVPIDQRLTISIYIGNYHPQVLCEGISLLCYHCGRIGHSVSSCAYKHIHTAPPTVSQHNSLHNMNTHLHVALHTTMPPPNFSQVHNPIIPTTPTTSIAITHHAKSNPLFPIIKRTVKSVATLLLIMFPYYKQPTFAQ